MAQVIGVVLTAGAYHRGVHCPGWSTIRLDDGIQLIIPGENGMLVPLDEAERRGHDANRMRERLEEWGEPASCRRITPLTLLAK